MVVCRARDTPLCHFVTEGGIALSSNVEFPAETPSSRLRHRHLQQRLGSAFIRNQGIAADALDGGADRLGAVRAARGNDDVLCLFQRIEIDGHHALVDGVIDGIALGIEEIEHGVADAARFDQLFQFALRDEPLRQRGRVRADVAAADDGQIEVLRQPVDGFEAAFFDQIALGLDRVDQQRRQEHIAFRPELACQAPRIVDRVGLMDGDDAAEQGDHLAIVTTGRAEACERCGHRPAPADADRIIVGDGFREKLAERQADTLCLGVDIAAGRLRNDDRFIEPIGALELDRQLHAVVDAFGDPDLHFGAAHGLIQQTNNRGAADAELFGNVLLRQALVVIEPRGTKPQRRGFRIGGMCPASQFGHRSSGKIVACAI
ncbi:hypothetical protein RHSP_43964 [Rhizobium freirei PRF 81]|uniref:Uncharacterized protein n=1 Tax=Rhizobium freirei PRF 81 TaxID=363754 RepID=N6UBG4_9HYPH|nr:hypothetical protein RHSP_43964 [Rhizobium freirei PRF 81]